MKKLIMILLLIIEGSYAATVSFSRKPIEHTISNQYNRLSFSFSEIIQAIGNKAKFDTVLLPASKEIVLFPKARIGEVIEISLVSSTGLVQDLLLKVKDISPTSIQINIPLPHKMLATVHTPETIDSFLEKILNNKIQLQPMKNEQLFKLRAIQATIVGSFEKGEFEGYLFNLKNKSNKSVKLSDFDFKIWLPHAERVYYGESHLAKNESTQVIIVRKI